MTFELVIFDNDGVLVDSERLANTILADLLTEHAVPTTFEDSVRDFMGGSLGRVHQVMAERTGRPLPDAFDDWYHARLFEAFEDLLAPVAGVADVLRALDAAHVRYCVASSGTHRRIRLALRKTGVLDRFEGGIFSAQDVARGKPAPDLFLHAAATLGVEPFRCAVVEDSPLGVEAARAAGMAVFGYAAMTPAERLAGADAVFASMAELPGLLGLG